MANNINILLDSLVVETEYEHSKNNTEPSILKGLFKNVSFVPWTEFPDIARSAIAAIERLRDEDLNDVNDSLRQARKFINRAKRNHARDVMLEQEKQARFETDISEDAVNSSFNSIPFEGSSTTLKPHMTAHVDATPHVHTSPEAKKPKQNPWYEQRSVTNSTSISKLHYYVFDALGDFLEILYPEEDLRLEQRCISSLNLLDGASGDMLREFMEKINPSPDPTREVAPTSDETAAQSTASETTGRRVSLRSESNLYGVANDTGSLLGMSVVEADNLSFPLQPLIPLNQTPDMCLFRKTLDESSKIPICCYEFKGPTLDLSGLLSPINYTNSSSGTGSANTVVNSSPASRASRGRSASRGRGASQGRGASRRRTASRARSPPRGRVETVASSAEMRDGPSQESSENGIYIPGASARDVASHYQDLFAIDPDSNPESGTKTETKLVVLPIAQVVCQAILSKTGCVFLTNHQISFALRVEEDSTAKVFGAKVYVTGAIPSDKKPGQVASLVGFTKYCLDRIAQNNTESLLNPLRRLMMGFSYRAFHAEVGQESLDPTWCPGDEPSNARGSRSHRARTRSVGKYMTDTEENQPMNVVSKVDDRSYERATLSVGPSHSTRNCFARVGSMDPTPPRCISEVSSVSSASDSESAKDDKELLRPVRCKVDERLRIMFSHSEGVLAIGASGIVIKGTWAGIKVAAKMWNGNTRDGFLNLRREIKNYQRIQEKCDSLFGLAVPKFFLGWDRPDAYSVYRKELILVTEYVGGAIFRSTDGRICVETENGTEALTRETEYGLCQSALFSRSQLHENGFIHGDIALRNMRVAKDETSKNGWTVWWLDLGRTLEINPTSSGRYSKIEVRQCRALFRLL